MTTTDKKTNAPSQIAYHVKKSKSGKDYWTRIGAVFPHADGKGSNLILDIMPLDGLITLRSEPEKSE